MGAGPADRRQRANFGGGLGEREANAEPPPASPEAGSARPAIRREACGFADIGRSNLWRPMVVERTGGSRWVQAQPANPSQTVKKLGRAREGRSPFELSIVPSGMYGGHGAIWRRKIPFSREKIVSLQAPRPKNL